MMVKWLKACKTIRVMTSYFLSFLNFVSRSVVYVAYCGIHRTNSSYVKLLTEWDYWFFLSENLTHAKEENLNLNQVLDQTLQELNSLWIKKKKRKPSQQTTFHVWCGVCVCVRVLGCVWSSLLLLYRVAWLMLFYFYSASTHVSIMLPNDPLLYIITQKVMILTPDYDDVHTHHE